MTNQMFSDGKGKLTTEGEATVGLGLSVLTNVIRSNNFEKGWRASDSEPRNVGELIALLHSEVSEAFEAYRNDEPPLWYEYAAGRRSNQPSLPEHDVYLGDTNPDGIVLGKPQGIASELADVIIRVLDMADEHEIPLVQAILDKHAYNQTRPYRHGGKKA